MAQLTSKEDESTDGLGIYAFMLPHDYFCVRVNNLNAFNEINHEVKKKKNFTLISFLN